MSTGLTFGSISALYGLTNGIINQAQYSVLVTVVIGFGGGADLYCPDLVPAQNSGLL